MKITNSKNNYLIVFYFVFVLVLIFIFLKSIIHGYSKESWNISEFLINYQGGFVRRGLTGEIILNLYKYIGIKPYTTILFTCISAYIILIVFFVRSFIKNGYPIFILPFVFFLGNPIINDFWVRKDVLIILFFIAIINFSIKKSDLQLILINLFFIIGLLIYEPLGFFCFPILFLLLINKNNGFNKTNSLIKFISISKLLPSIFTFFCVLYFKGSPIVSNQIWNSWKPVVFPIQNKNDNLIPAAINGLSWSLKQGISFTGNTLLNFQNNIYAPIAWLLILLLIYYLLTNISILNLKIVNYKLYKDFNITNFSKATTSNILIIQLFAIIPLFILGWDYGRWVFFWVISSFAIIILVPENKLSSLIPKSILIISTKINEILDLLLSKSKGFLVLLCMIIGFPTFSWDLTSCIDSNSLVIVLKLISKGIHTIIIFLKS